MSDSLPVVGIVAEGPTDHAVLVAVIEGILRRQIQPLYLQPVASDAFGDFGPHGAGFKGVWSWCREVVNDSDIPTHMTGDFGPGLDALVVHVDADIASHPDMDCERPCPPATDTAALIEEILLEWLGLARRPDNVVLAIPSKSIETWILTALAHEGRRAAPCDECTPEPALLLTRHPYRHLRTRDGKTDKDPQVYLSLSQSVTSHWSHVAAKCGQAAAFDCAIRACLLA